MRVVKKVSLLKSIERVDDPPPSAFKMDRVSYHIDGPYRLNNTQELYRFGYRNFKHKAFLTVAGLAALILGAVVESTEKVFLDVTLI